MSELLPGWPAFSSLHIVGSLASKLPSIMYISIYDSICMLTRMYIYIYTSCLILICLHMLGLRTFIYRYMLWVYWYTSVHCALYIVRLYNCVVGKLSAMGGLISLIYQGNILDLGGFGQLVNVDTFTSSTINWSMFRRFLWL